MRCCNAAASGTTSLSLPHDHTIVGKEGHAGLKGTKLI